MGVTGFFHFIESDPRLHQKDVDVVSYARGPAAAAGRQPVLVVDLSNVLREVWRDLDWFAGGQHAEFRNRMADFVRNFKSQGIHLVFVTDGATPEDKVNHWLDRQIERVRTVEKAFDDIYDGGGGGRQEAGDRTPKVLPNVEAPRLLRSLGCEVVASLEDGDLRAAREARDRRAFGVLAYDSDYFFFPDMAGVRIFSNRSRELYAPSSAWSTLRTTSYDPEAVAAALGVGLARMPVLASLLNTDYVSRIKLRAFHEAVMGSAGPVADRGRLIGRLARRIAGFGADLDDETLVGRLLVDGLGREAPKLCSNILASVRTYRTDPQPKQMWSPEPVVWDLNNNDPGGSAAPPPELEEEELEPAEADWWEALRLMASSYALGEGHFPFPVALGHHWTSPVVVEDERTGLPYASDVGRHVRRSIYGLLFRDAPPPDGGYRRTVAEWAVAGEQSVKRMKAEGPCRVEPRPPPPGAPSLLALHTKTDEETSAARWDLLAWALVPDGVARPGGLLDGTVLSRLDPRDTCLFCCLAAMSAHRQEGEDLPWLARWQARAVVAAHFALRRRNEEDGGRDGRHQRRYRGNRGAAGGKADPEAAHLATIYNELPVAALHWVLGGQLERPAFGLRDQHLDGLIFQEVYKSFKKDPKSAWDSWAAETMTDEEAEGAEAMLAHLEALGRNDFY